MNNIQLYLSIGIPTLTVILAWLSNRSDLNRLNDKVDAMNERLSGRIDAAIDAHHKDNLALMGYMIPLHERMAKLEQRD